MLFYIFVFHVRGVRIVCVDSFVLPFVPVAVTLNRAHQDNPGGGGDYEQEHLLREQNAIHSSLQSATGVLG